MWERAEDARLLGAFAKVAAACGTGSFYPVLLDAIGTLIRWDTCGVIQFSKYAVPQYILTRDVPEQEMTFYLSGFYRLDPFLQYWRRGQGEGVLSLARVSDRVDDSDYRSSFQPRTGMMDEIGILCRKFPGVADDLFFLRQEPFSAQELARLDAAFALIKELHALNVRLGLAALPSSLGGTSEDRLAGASSWAVLDAAGKMVFTSPGWEQEVAGDPSLSDAVQVLAQSAPPDTLPFSGGYVTSHQFDKRFALSPAGRLILVFPGETARTALSWNDVLTALHGGVLTPRELEICRLVLQGHPTAGIAKILEISVGTVKNHRKRIYRKLDITSERELFLTVLSYTARP